LCISIEKAWGSSTNDTIQRRDPLLPIEEKFHDAGGKYPIASMRRRFRLSSPHQQSPNRVSAIKRFEETPNLIPIPYVSALEFRKGHVTTIDVVEDHGNLHA
jgi:hypothetical protein